MKIFKISNLLLLLSLAPPMMADEVVKPANLLVNGGFEKWTAPIVDANTKKESPVVEGYWFNSEAYERNQDPKFPVTVAFSRDSTLKHAGDSSVRIQNSATTDIGGVALQPMTISANTHYILKGWVRGENITLDEKSGVGICLWTNVGPTQDFWVKMKNDMHTVDKKDGTFDWTPFEVKFDSASDTGQLMFSLQLRRASGTAWFDDVELISDGPV